RWYVSGRVPMGNGYETMLFMSLVIIMLALIFGNKIKILTPFGFLISGFTLLVAWLGQRNPQITPLMPVLNSPILSAHVSTIMIAYSLLAFTFFNGIFSFFIKDEEKLSQLTVLSRIMLYPAEILLGIGIFLGAVWANISWGRYWSWDPKETWALITFMVYAVGFHRFSLKFLQNQRRMHLFFILAFLTVLMTYFGVNYFLGGMHSYANG
ncbi:MAG: cytochrome c biogenesis protein CcsA, partial [Bacteroidales bacterium]|nr:cytochrome c biogenesis protein CcsA [Bacteroidales bacterium]